MTQLTTEQQFSIHSFAHQVRLMSESQAKELLINLHQQMLVREATYQELLKHEWGISNLEGLG